MVHNLIKFPEMRNDLINTLESLSNLEYQQKVWVKGEKWENVEHDEFNYAIHFLYDDTSLGDGALDSVGVFLKTADEAKLLDHLIEVLDRIFEVYGTDLDDEQYLQLTEWPEVISRSKKALDLILLES